MSERTYKVEITSATKDLTYREKIALKNFSDMKQLDEEVSVEKGLLIHVDYVVTARVHNEKADNPDYLKNIYVDKDGTKYISGSQPLFNQFSDIFDELKDCGDTDDISIKVIKKESDNYKGKHFLTCVLV